jgi:hypothetical protein
MTADEIHERNVKATLRDLGVMLKRAEETQNGKAESIKNRIAAHEAMLKKPETQPTK